jgi:flagellar basal body rod protein FlgG
MNVPLELTTGEEEALTRDGALTTDSKGRLTLVGLTVEESIWYIEYKRQWLAERIDDTLHRKSREGRKRYLELYERHEFARLQVIGVEHEVRTENPTKN